MNKILIVLLYAALFAACSGSSKRVVVFSKGAADINTDAKTIKAKDGGGNEEKEMILGSSNFTFAISSPAGQANIDIDENGLFVVNAKTDTIIGSYQKYGNPQLAKNMITQEKAKHDLDSLRLLVENKNVTPAHRNFFILPNHAAKLSDNIQADVIGPFHRMRSAEKVDGKDPEIYRFYSIKEIREMIVKYEELTKPVLK